MNIYRFIPNKISALLFSLICVLTLAACAGGEPNPPAGISVLDLRIIPDETNVTLIWDNPDADIANISISYKNSTAVNFEEPILTITDNDSILPNITVTKMIDGLTNGSTYTFRVALKLEGDDENATTSAMQIIRQIGPNLDGDDLVDADSRELDEDGDGVNDNLDAFPRNRALSAFAVTDLTARPGNGEVTLNWNNPAANISSISISYQRDDSVGQLMMNSSAQITPGERNVQETIDGLTNGQSYTFNVTLTLTGDDAGKKVAVASDTATPDVFSVTNLAAVPNDSSVTLSWTNPDADIASISISYEIDGSGASTTVGAGNTGRVASVEQTIGGLTNEEYYNFIVDLTLADDYAGGEGEAASIIVGIGPNLDGDELADFEDNDIDGDNTLNSADVDADGDGLIEISTAEQLNQVRYNLLGSSLNTSDGVAGDANGCGGLNGISDCNGYELTQNISLDGYNSDNWVPIGSCRDFKGTGNNPCTTVSSLFSTTFDGNGWTISNLTITNPAAPYNNGAGLFGAISPDSILRNVHIRSANISDGGKNVGMLVGYAQGARISNSSAEGEVTATGAKVGGLVGDGVDANITSSYVTGGSISGFSTVGGLIGAGNFAFITSSYALDITILSDISNAGGLLGSGIDTNITSSYVVGGSVIGQDGVGGMTGNGQSSAKITSSYVADLFISGRSNIGGMVGTGNSIITSSYVGSGVDIIGTGNNVAGMIGSGDGATIKSSYSVAESISGSANLGGMVGFGTLNSASSNSYWNNETSGITGGSVAGKSEGKTTTELVMPTDFPGSIYVNWEDDLCADGTAAWHLGLNDQYPALNCTPGGADAQRP